MRQTVFPIALVLVAGTMIWAIYYMFNKDARPGDRALESTIGAHGGQRRDQPTVFRGRVGNRAIALGSTNVIPFVGWLIEPIITIASDDGRRLGDRWAGTQVISVEMHRVDD